MSDENQTRSRLSKAQEKSLDAALLKYLTREPKRVWDVMAYAELHSEEEIIASLKRLQKGGRACLIHNDRLGTCWAARAL